MADNTLINPGTGGDTIATDDIADGGVATGAKVQRVKLGVGVDGGYADVVPANTARGTTGTGVPAVGAFGYDGTNHRQLKTDTAGSLVPSNTELTGTSTTTGTPIASTDVRGYARFSLQLAGTFTGTIQVQGSNDGTTWTALTTFTLGSQGAPNVADLTAVGIYVGAVATRYLRVQCTAYTSGTITSTLELAATPGLPASLTSATLPGTSTVTSVASSATNVTLLAANSGRKQAIVYNDSTSVLYVKFGTTASTSSYTYQVQGGGYLEMPAPVYTGRIDGIWASANGNARVTELA